jgi:hypothetical protein
LQDEIILLRVHSGYRKLRDVSFLSPLTLHNDGIEALIVVEILACVLIVVNNDAETLTNCFGWKEPTILSINGLIGDLRATLRSSSIFRLFAEAAKHLRSLTRDGGKLELDGNVFTLEVKWRDLVDIDASTLGLDFSGLIPTILKVVERLRDWSFYDLN